MAFPHETAARLIRFTAVGLAAMAVYAGLVVLLTLGGVSPAWLASGLAYALAAVWSYIGHRRFSFRSSASHAVAGPRFAVVTGVGQGLAVLLPALITDIGGFPALWSTLAVCVVCPGVSFLLNSRFVFSDGRSLPSAP
jgi:putative flippase GtrA